MPPATRLLADDRPRVLLFALFGFSVALNRGLLFGAPLLVAGLWRPRWLRTPVDVPLAVFVAWSVLAGAVSEFWYEALPTALLTAAAVYLYFQVPHRWMRDHPGLVTSFLRGVAAGVPVAAAMGLFAYLYVPDLGLGEFRRFALPGSPPAVLAWTLEVGMLLTLGLLPGGADQLSVSRAEPLAPRARAGRRLDAFLVFLALTAGTIGLAGTFSRWAILGFCAGLAVWALRMRRRPRDVAIVIVTVAVSALAAAALPWTRTILAQYLPAVGGERHWGTALTLGFASPVSLPERAAIWATALRMIGAHPWLGVGPGVFVWAYLRYFDPAMASLPVLELPVHLHAPHAHNETLMVAACAGLPAAAAYVALIVRGLLRALGRPGPRSAAAGAALVAVVVHGVFDAVSNGSAAPFVAFWTLMALVVLPEQAP